MSFKTTPYRHQQEEFDRHRNEPARALLWQMRSGKTKTCVDLACDLYLRGEIDCVLVAAPNNVHLNWLLRELPVHHWDNVPRMSLAWQASQFNSTWTEHFEALRSFRGLAWFSFNHEALIHPKAKGFIANLLKLRKCLLIVDEVHEFRRPQAKRSVSMLQLAPRCRWRRILTGTSSDNSPLHTFMEFQILKPGALGCETYEEFEAKYAVKDDVYIPGGYKKDGTKRSPRKIPAVVGYQNQEDLQSRIASWSSLVLRQDCDDMPDLVRSQQVFELTDTQKRLYNDLCRDVIARLDSGEMIEPVEGGVLRIRLQQIASGFIVDADGVVRDIISDKENPRLDLLLGEIVTAPGKVLVWCQFREDIRRVMRMLEAHKIGAVDYFGGTTPKQRLANERSFREDPKTLVLVGQPAAGGQGLDFSAASDIIWYSHTSDNIRRKQADERATKVGGRKIGVADLVALGSIDEKILEDLSRKEETSDFLTGRGLKRYFEAIS